MLVAVELNKQNKRKGGLCVSELVKTLYFQLFSKQTCSRRGLLWGVSLTASWCSFVPVVRGVWRFRIGSKGRLDASVTLKEAKPASTLLSLAFFM